MRARTETGSPDPCYLQIKVAPRDSRGIYLRGKVDTSRVQQTNVNVSPTFRKDDVGQNGRKLAYEQRLTLVSSVPWVRVPEFLLLNSGGRDFSVKVDPTTLPAGFHYTEIRAYDTTCVEKGPVFYVPVSVTKATPLKDNKLVVAGTYFSGKIERQFVDVPAGASWAGMTVISCRV